MKDLSVLQEAPFTDHGSIVEVFTDLSVWAGIRQVIERVNANAAAWRMGSFRRRGSFCHHDHAAVFTGIFTGRKGNQLIPVGGGNPGVVQGQFLDGGDICVKFLRRFGVHKCIVGKQLGGIALKGRYHGIFLFCSVSVSN